MSLIIALMWLTNEESLTLATWALVVVTLLLVVATGFLYFDSREKGKQQTERWEREDRAKAEEAKPRAFVELGKRASSPHVIALCYNLGEHSFIVDRLTVNVQDRTTQVSDIGGPYVVLPGNFLSVEIDCSRLLTGGLQRHDSNITFHLQGATGMIATDPVLFNFYPSGPNNGYGWGLGGPERRRIGMIVQQPRMIPEDSNCPLVRAEPTAVIVRTEGPVVPQPRRL